MYVIESRNIECMRCESSFLGGLRYPTDVMSKQPLEQTICFTQTAGRTGIQIILSELFIKKTEGVIKMFIQ